MAKSQSSVIFENKREALSILLIIKQGKESYDSLPCLIMI